MTIQRLSRRKIRRRRAPEEESSLKSRPVNRSGDRFGLISLQRQVGNRAIQQLIAQRQAAEQADQDDEAAAKAPPVEAGQIKIEKPEIEEYEVQGGNLAEVSNQVLAPEKWYEYEYQYNPKVENGVTTQVDVLVKTKIRLPRWVGPGWEHASEMDKGMWLGLLKEVVGDEEEYDRMGETPQQWVGVDWDKAPERLKNEWRAMLQEWHSKEQSRLDIVLRRVMVLQQRMLNRPQEQLNTIFDQFQKDIEEEEEAYNKQRAFGQVQKIALSNQAMIQ